METLTIDLKKKKSFEIGQQGDHNALCIHFINMKNVGTNKKYIYYTIDGIENCVPLTNDRFIIGYPLTAHSGIASAQLISKLNDNSIIKLSNVFAMNIKESKGYKDSGEYPVDPNIQSSYDLLDDLIDQTQDLINNYNYATLMEKLTQASSEATTSATTAKKCADELKSSTDFINTLDDKVVAQDSKIEKIEASTSYITTKQNTKIAALQTRMSEFTSLKDGSTTGDAELIDARIGADGTKYASAGDAMRGQVEQINEALDNFVSIDYNLKRITQFDGIRNDNVNVINNGGNSDVHTVDGGMFFEIHVKEGDTYQFNTKVTGDNFRYVITNSSNNIIASSNDSTTELKVRMPKNAYAILINNNQNLLPQSECNIFLVESLSNNNDKHIYYSTDLPNGMESMVGDGQTDNTRQFQAILNYMAENGGGTLIVKDGVYAFNQKPVDKDDYNSIIKLPYVASTSASPVPINIVGENEIATAYPENVAVQPIENGAIFLVTADTTGIENTKFPAFIGAKHTGSETYNNLDYTDITLNLKNLIFRQQQQGALTDLQLRYVANVNLENIVCDCTGDYSTLIYSAYNTSHGVIMPTINNYGFEKIRNLYVIGRGTGLKHSEHLDADNLFFQRCGTAIAIQQSHHAIYYGKILVQHCIFAISGEGQARIYNGVLDVELNEGDDYKFINDYSNNLYGDITIHAVFGGIGAKNDMETISKYIGGANNLVINTEEIPTLTGNTDSEKLENLINILKTKKVIR